MLEGQNVGLKATMTRVNNSLEEFFDFLILFFI